MLHQSDQDFERPGTNQNGLVAFEQETPIGMQAKRTEGDRGILWCGLLIGCFGRSQAGPHAFERGMIGEFWLLFYLLIMARTGRRTGGAVEAEHLPALCVRFGAWIIICCEPTSRTASRRRANSGIAFSHSQSQKWT